MNNRMLSPSAAKSKYQVNVPNGMEGIYEPLYDFIPYPQAGTTELTFFQLPIGQDGKKLNDTNMRAAGQLPSPQQFLVNAIEVHFLPEKWEDGEKGAEFAKAVYDVLSKGQLQLTIGSKVYATLAPLYVAPPANGFVGEFAKGEGVAATYLRSGGKTFNLQAQGAQVMIPPNQNFDVSIKFDDEVALPADMVARIGVRLDGILYRSQQ